MKESYSRSKHFVYKFVEEERETWITPWNTLIALVPTPTMSICIPIPLNHQFGQWRNPIRAVSILCIFVEGERETWITPWNTLIALVHTPTMWQMNTHNPMERGISYPRCSFPGSVTANMVKISTNVRRSSIPKAWAPFIFSAGLVTPRSPCIWEGVRPYKSAAPRIPGNNNKLISKVEWERLKKLN